MALLLTKTRAMFLVDQRLLTKMWEENKVSIAIEFHQTELKEQDGWEAHVITNDGVAIFMTAKGGVRRWRQLNAAVREIQVMLPELKEFKVVTM